MISNATRILCAMLSVIGAAGLVAFTDPAPAVGNRHPAAPAPLVAADPAGIARHG